MRRIVLLLALVGLLASSAQAQIVGASSDGYQTETTTTSTSKGPSHWGSVICLTGVTVGCVYTIIGAAADLDAMLFAGLGVMAGSTLLAVPFWIVGARRNRGVTGYTPMIDQDFRLNDDLKLTTSLGTSYCSRMPGMDRNLAMGPGVGVSLNF